MAQKKFVLSFNGQKFWVKLSHDGNTTLDVCLIDTATGDEFVGNNNHCTATTFATTQANNSELRAGTTPHVLKFDTENLANTNGNKQAIGDTAKLNNRLDYIIWQNDKQVGMIKAYSSDGPIPPGWLECNGQEVPIVRYGELYNILYPNRAASPHIWGVPTNPATYFRLPDLRGRTLVGSGTGAGLTTRTLGNSIGFETHTLSVDELPSHVHNGVTQGGNPLSYIVVNQSGPNANPVHVPGWAGGPNTAHASNGHFGPSYNYTGAPDQNYPASGHTHNFVTHATGNGQPHNNMQPSSVVKFIIQY
jgi:microcystin-dependent protein